MRRSATYQCLAPAKHLCGGGVILAILAWISWTVLFGTFVSFRNRQNYCNSECYDSSFCWTSNVTSDFANSSITTLCAGAGVACLDNCAVPYETQLEYNVTDDGSMCMELNYCDEIVEEEGAKVSECSLEACKGVPAMNSVQLVMTLLGLLLILLSGTICLNFYKEAVNVNKPWCAPCKEAGGRLCLYGSVVGSVISIIFVIVQLATVPKEMGAGGSWADLVVVVVFVYVIGLNAILVLCACAGRCLLAEDLDQELVVADAEEGVPVENKTASVSDKTVLE